MAIEKPRQDTRRRDGGAPIDARVAAATVERSATQSATIVSRHSSRTLAAVVAVPAIFVLGVGSFVVDHDDLANATRPDQPRSLYDSLKEPFVGTGSAYVHAGGVDAMVWRLEERLKAEPNDADGWRVLGWSYFRTGNFDKAADAYDRASKLEPENAVLKSLYGEALVASAMGRITPKAQRAFRSVLQMEPNDVRARFYSGQAKLQDGDATSALDIWIALLKRAPEGATWAKDLRARILDVSRQSEIDISGSLPPPQTIAMSGAASPARLTASDIEKARHLTPNARHAMARDMVKRLSQRLNRKPNDPEGWIMLIRSRTVLREQKKASAALKRALVIFSDSPETRQRIMRTAQELQVSVDE